MDGAARLVVLASPHRWERSAVAFAVPGETVGRVLRGTRGRSAGPKEAAELSSLTLE